MVTNADIQARFEDKDVRNSIKRRARRLNDDSGESMDEDEGEKVPGSSRASPILVEDVPESAAVSDPVNADFSSTLGGVGSALRRNADGKLEAR